MTRRFISHSEHLSLAVLLAIAAVFGLLPSRFSPVFAVSPSSAPSNPLGPVAGNYCVACHVANDSRLSHAADWRGSSAAPQTACPGLLAEDEQLYYAERQLLAAARIAPGKESLAPLYASYATLLDAPRDSVDAFSAEAQLFAYKGGKAYGAFNQELERGRRLRALIVAGLVSAFLLFALAWGLRITLRARPIPRVIDLLRPTPRTAGLFAVVLMIFALPLFRAPALAVATSSAEDQAVQAELDRSSRAGAVAERSLARAWMLGRIAAAWAPVDPARGQQVLAEALAAEAQARADADALWGRAQASQEAAVGSAAAQDKARLISEELLAVRQRAWPLRLIAAEWARVDLKQAANILSQAEAVARANPTLYGHLDLAAIADTWPQLEPGRTIAVPPLALPTVPAAPASVAEALRLYRAGDYGRAWSAAAQITDEWDRARAEAAIAEGWQNPDVAQTITIQPLRQRTIARIEAATPAALPTDPDAALAAIERLTSESAKAHALRTLAVSTGDAGIFDRALKMAAAARVRGDPLAPAQASLALAQAFTDRAIGHAQVAAALAQAYDLTVKISVKYR